jgi:malonyl-CoA O-methyltransferase
VKPGGSLILTDFHPAAAAQGWRRTFRAKGQVFEIENHSYTLDQLAAEGFVLRESRDAVFEEPERVLFDQAGKSGLFETARHTPAVLAAWWTRL